MKSLFILLAQIVTSLGFAQTFPIVFSDFTQPIPGNYNQFNLDTSNVMWQIGHSYKFDSLLSAKPALYTDTLGPYPSNQQESIQMILYGAYPGYGPYGGYELQFTSRFQTTLGQDGGYIEMSIDSGVTWFNLLDLDSLPPPYPDGEVYAYLGQRDTILPNGQRSAYTGNGTSYSVSFIRVQFFFAFVAPPEGYDDKVYLRFSFFSDSVSDNLPGWQINDFMIYGIYPSGIREEVYPIIVSPNPSAGVFTIQSLNHEKLAFTILNQDGKLIMEDKMDGIAKEVDLQGFPTGIYLLKFNGGRTIRLLKQ